MLLVFGSCLCCFIGHLWVEELNKNDAMYCNKWRKLITLTLLSHISRTTHPNFTKFSVHVACGRGLVLLWRECNMLCTSIFVDDIFQFNAVYGPEQRQHVCFIHFITWRHQSDIRPHWLVKSVRWWHQVKVCCLRLHIVKDIEQGVALMGRNCTGPPCSVGHPTADLAGSPTAHSTARRKHYRLRQTTTTDGDRQQMPASRIVLVH